MFIRKIFSSIFCCIALMTMCSSCYRDSDHEVREMQNIIDILGKKVDPSTGLVRTVSLPSNNIQDTYSTALLLGDKSSNLSSENLETFIKDLANKAESQSDEITFLKSIFILQNFGFDAKELLERYKNIEKNVPDRLDISSVAYWSSVLDLKRKVGIRPEKPTLMLWAVTDEESQHYAFLSTAYADIYKNGDEVKNRYSKEIDSFFENVDNYDGSMRLFTSALRAANVSGSTSRSARGEAVDTLRSNPSCSLGEEFLSGKITRRLKQEGECSLQQTAELRYAGYFSW